MGRILNLAQTRTSKETIDTLKALLEEAQAGEIVGFAYIALHNRTGYSADVTGTAKTSPELTIGVMRILELRLSPRLAPLK